MVVSQMHIRLVPPPTFASNCSSGDISAVIAGTGKEELDLQAKEDTSLLIESLTSQQVKRSRSIIHSNREKTLAYHAAKLALQQQRHAALLSASSASSVVPLALPRPTASRVMSMSMSRSSVSPRTSTPPTCLTHSAFLVNSLQQKDTDKGAVLRVKVRCPPARTKHSTTTTTSKYFVWCNTV